MASEQDSADRLELLWGSPQRPSRGPKPALSVEQIIEAAIALADERGLEALSMRAVAERLGFTTMSLYRYLPSKAELLELMLDAAIGAAPAAGEVAGEWREKLEHWAREVYAVYQHHPWVLQAPISAPPMGPNRVAWLEAGLEALSSTGLAARELPSTVLALDGYVRGAAQVSVGIAEAEKHTGLPADEWEATFARIMERVVADERFPNLAAIVSAGAFEELDSDPDHDFEFGLQRLLDGIDEFVRSR